MGMFSDLKTEGLEDSQDRLGGFAPLETNAYEATIKVAYAGKSSGGANSITLMADLGGREYRETIYITNKKGENFFLNKDDKTKKVPLPGFTVVDHLCLVTTDAPLSEQETEEKVVNVWDNDAKKELPKSVQVLTGLTGKKVFFGILNNLENKSEKNAAGDYVPIADTRNVNVIDKVFHNPTKMTVVEAASGSTEPAFFDKWVAANAGKTRDRRELKDGATGSGGTSGKPNAGPPAAGSTSAPRTSLFGK